MGITVLGQLPPRKIAPPNLLVKLILNQTLTLTGGNISRGQMSGHLAEELQKYPYLYEKGSKGYEERETGKKTWRIVENFLIVFSEAATGGVL